MDNSNINQNLVHDANASTYTINKNNVNNNGNILYNSALLQIEIHVHLNEIVYDIKELLLHKIIQLIGNKCIQEGFVSSKNIEVITFSEGSVNFTTIVYNVQYKCNLALPIYGQIFTAKVKSITKAGIYTVLYDEYGCTPLTIFICRDYNNTPHIDYIKIKDNDYIVVKLIDLRYELYDTTISSIGILI
jgi:DNA-directed RNA polymerase subunit E'/Rpb7